MKRNLFLVFCLSAGALQAQQTNEVEALKRQLHEATEKFDRALQEHSKIMDDLNRRLQQVQAAQTNGRTDQSLTSAATTNEIPDRAPRGLTDPVRLGTQRAYMDIGLVGTFA